MNWIIVIIIFTTFQPAVQQYFHLNNTLVVNVLFSRKPVIFRIAEFIRTPNGKPETVSRSGGRTLCCKCSWSCLTVVKHMNKLNELDWVITTHILIISIRFHYVFKNIDLINTTNWRGSEISSLYGTECPLKFTVTH